MRVWRHFSLSVERVFCSFAWLNFWSHLTYLTLKNDFLTLKFFLFTLIQRDKIKWVCVTLNEGYLRAADRGSRNFYQNIIYQPSMKRRFFSLSFLLFLRLQICEAIAAVFWQSASYVFSYFHSVLFQNYGSEMTRGTSCLLCSWLVLLECISLSSRLLSLQVVFLKSY